MRDGVTTGRIPAGGEGPGGRWLPEGHISKKRGGSRKAAGAKGPRPLVSPAAEAGIMAGAGPRVGNDAPEQSGGGGSAPKGGRLIPGGGPPGAVPEAVTSPIPAGRGGGRAEYGDKRGRGSGARGPRGAARFLCAVAF